MKIKKIISGLLILGSVLVVSTDPIFAKQAPSVSYMKEQLTDKDIKEATPIEKKIPGSDDIGMPITGTPGINNQKPAASYPNVNNYIAQKNFKRPNITKELYTFEMFSYKTSDGLPTGVVIHYTDNPNNFSARSEANYEINGGWKSAFVHTFIDAGTILNIHDTNYGAWGCGPVGNSYFVQFEMVTARNFDDFAKTTSFSAWYTAFMLRQYDLVPSLAQSHNGVGTVWTHHNVSQYLGGTNHTDPTAYFAKYGYNINQFYTLIQSYYNKLPLEKVSKHTYLNKVGEVKDGKAEYWLTDNGIKPSNQTTKNLVNKKVTVTQLITTTTGKKYYLATVDGKQVAWIPIDAFVSSN